MILESLDVYKKEYINKGFSKEKKYKLQKGGKKYLLKLTPTEQRSVKELEKKYSSFLSELPCCKLLELDFGKDEIKSIYSWIDGVDFREAKVEDYYSYGVQAGRILKKIHQVPVDEDIQNWQQMMNEKVDRKIAGYKKVEHLYPKGKYFVSYLDDNRDLLANRCLSLCHGDFHAGNMMINEDGELVVVDFGTLEINDPYEEFNRLTWSALVSKDFAKGIIAGYFEGGEIPDIFWSLMKFYIAMDILSSIPWAADIDNEQLEIMRNRADKVLEWYDNYNKKVPSFWTE